MAGTVQFNRDYAVFGKDVKPYEKADDVGTVVSQIVCTWSYPIGALINAKISGIWLGEGEKPAGDVENIDLLFKMAPPGEPYIELVETLFSREHETLGLSRVTVDDRLVRFSLLRRDG